MALLRDDERVERAPEDEVHGGTRLLLTAFLGLTLLAVVELLVFTSRSEHDFAWSISTELTAAFLGAAFGAGFVLSLLALRERRWSRIRVPVLTVTAFTALTCAATLIHLHRLHLTDGGTLARAASWFWLAVYLVVPVACTWVLARQEHHRSRPRAPRHPMPSWLVALLAVQGSALFAGGTVLFVGGLTVHHHAKVMTHFWPWELTPLSCQVVGAWLIAFGLAAALAIRDRDLSRMLVPAVTYTVLGVLELLVLLRYRSQVDPADPRFWIYTAFLGAVVATGGYGWWSARRRTQDDGDDPSSGRSRRHGAPVARREG